MAVSCNGAGMGDFVGCLLPPNATEPQGAQQHSARQGEVWRPGKVWTVNAASFPPSLFLPNHKGNKAKSDWPGVSQSLAKN